MGEDEWVDGLMFDGSSIEGWKAINESGHGAQARPRGGLYRPLLGDADADRVLRRGRAVDGRAVFARSAFHRQARRSVSEDDGHRRHRLCRAGSRVLHVRRCAASTRPTTQSYFKIDDIELPTNTGREYEGGNLAHRPRAKGGYFPVAPVDSAVDIRGEMVSTMLEMGLPCDKHHHEVAAAQHELGLTFGTLTTTADRMQIYKYVVHQVAACVRQDRDVHAQADQGGQRLGDAHPLLDLERQGSRCSRAMAMPGSATCACSSSAASSSMPRR